ncbi:MAG: hypothetical protein O2815_04265 [Actinomycetota bacterium]|nr:hypothetical protein [Actinomycetota bacterium]
MDSPLVARMREHATSVFAEMSHLARRTESINLGQGFPDTDGPAEIDVTPFAGPVLLRAGG